MSEQQRKKISIATVCYNEKDNIREYYRQCIEALSEFPQYDYEIIMADNCSTDGTRDIMREIAAQDPNFKCIFNANNFGVSRSGYNSLLHATGDAAITMGSDLQDPPALFGEFIRKWEAGYKVVCAIKNATQENRVMATVRQVYYRLLSSIAETPLLNDYDGFGLYDKQVVDALRRYQEPNPYFRGMICEVGFEQAKIYYTKLSRKHGISSYNLLSYFDYAMTGIVNHTRLPLRLAMFSGFVLAIISLLIACCYFALKLIYWDTFSLGLAPLVIGLFFFSAIQLLFVGILGEYMGAIWVQVKNKPLVIEDELINF